MKWIRCEAESYQDPKFEALASALGVTLYAARGLVHGIELWACSYADLGLLTRFPARSIARAADWDGDAEVFLEALSASGFVESNGNELLIVGWAERAKEYHKKTGRDRQRENRSRVSSVRGQSADSPSHRDQTDQIREDQTDDYGEPNAVHHADPRVPDNVRRVLPALVSEFPAINVQEQVESLCQSANNRAVLKGRGALEALRSYFVGLELKKGAA